MTEYLTDYTEYEAFTAQHPNGHVLQSHLWAAQKSNWHWQAIVSRDESGSIQGSIAILTRKLPLLPLTIAYGSRGPICPPDRTDILEELLLAAGQYAKSQHAVFCGWTQMFLPQTRRMPHSCRQWDFSQSLQNTAISFSPSTSIGFLCKIRPKMTCCPVSTPKRAITSG